MLQCDTSYVDFMHFKMVVVKSTTEEISFLVLHVQKSLCMFIFCMLLGMLYGTQFKPQIRVENSVAEVKVPLVSSRTQALVLTSH